MTYLKWWPIIPIALIVSFGGWDIVGHHCVVAWTRGCGHWDHATENANTFTRGVLGIIVVWAVYRLLYRAP
jgi:hypothetical protein